MRSDLIASGAVVPVFQIMPIEPGLALLDDSVTDPKEKALLELLSAPQRLGLPVIGPPGLSVDLTRTLLHAYLKMVASKDYLDESIKRCLDMGRPNTGRPKRCGALN